MNRPTTRIRIGVDIPTTIPAAIRRVMVVGLIVDSETVEVAAMAVVEVTAAVEAVVEIDVRQPGTA